MCTLITHRLFGMPPVDSDRRCPRRPLESKSLSPCSCEFQPLFIKLEAPGDSVGLIQGKITMRQRDHHSLAAQLVCLPRTRARPHLSRVSSSASIATTVLEAPNRKRRNSSPPTTDSSDSGEEPQWRFSSLCDTIECAADLLGLSMRGRPMLESKRRKLDAPLSRRPWGELEKTFSDRRKDFSPRSVGRSATPACASLSSSPIVGVPLTRDNSIASTPSSPSSVMIDGLHPDVRSHIGRGWSPELLAIALELGAPVPSVFGSLRRRNIEGTVVDMSHDTLVSTFGL
ncbi:hypothetical protein AB1Y20_022649 [Prymnesium parvum]|uniref:Uncharacterized protein n=1 Tax=Prymnesium parvum TaxID=97485 RepID=A0AB34JJL1_PRYPA